MARIKLETTQNVLLEFDLAGAGDRIVAGLLDLLFIMAYYFVCWMIFFVILSFRFDADADFFLIIVLIVVPPAFLYHLLFELFMNGQSPGKKIMKIKVIKLDGSQPGLGDYVLRWMFRTIDCQIWFLIPTYLVAIITIAVTKREQRIGDIVSNTTVIKLKKRATLDDTILRVVEMNYKPVFADVMKFSDQDINTIKEVLTNYYRTNNYKQVEKLSAKVREILNVSPTEMSSTRMLETVIKDYNYFAQAD